MDLFHQNPMLAGIRQMLGAFAKQSIRPIAPRHDEDESMPWDLMKAAAGFGMSQSALIDGTRGITGKDADADADADPATKKPRTTARTSVRRRIRSLAMPWTSIRPSPPPRSAGATYIDVSSTASDDTGAVGKTAAPGTIAAGA